MNKSSLDVVNPHYLKNVMEISKEQDVVANEDIYNSRGIKLISKGTRLDDSMHERLARFKLRRPLEYSLSVGKPIEKDLILKELQSLLDEIEPLAGFLRSRKSFTKVTSFLDEINIDAVSSLLLTMENSECIGKFRHSVLVSLFALAFGIELKLSSNMLGELALAGLLHDVGELYINQDYLKADRELTPEEWKHVAVHPHLGHIVITEMTEYSPNVATAIAEHHERPNGFGYPRQVTDNHISPLGRILLVCESLCGILGNHGKEISRACLALKVIPGEYPPELVSLVASLPLDSRCAAAGGMSEAQQCRDLIARIKSIMRAVEAATKEIERATSDGNLSSCSRAFLHQVHKRLTLLKKAMHDAGLSPSDELESLACDDASELAFEMGTVVNEIRWRVRELSRQIALQNMSSDEASRQWFDGIVKCLVTD